MNEKQYCQHAQSKIAHLHGVANERKLFGDTIWLCEPCEKLIENCAPDQRDRYFWQSSMGRMRANMNTKLK